MKNISKKYLFLAILIIVVTGISAYIFLGNSTGEFSFTTTKVEKGSVSNTITATGTLEATNTVVVGTQVSGVVEKIYVDFNSKVNKGDLIAELDKSTLQFSLENSEAEVANAQAEFNYQKSNYERMKEVFDKGLLSNSDYDLATFNFEKSKAALKSAKANLKRAEKNLSYASIYAPIDGVVLNCAVEEGQTVTASMSTPELFTIVNDLTTMQVEANIDEADIGQVKIGQRVEFTEKSLHNFLKILAFYINYLVFVPKYFFSKKKHKFTLSLVLLTLIILTSSHFVSKKYDFFPPPNNPKRHLTQHPEARRPKKQHQTGTDLFSIHPKMLDEFILLLLVLGFSTGMRLIQKSKKEEIQKKDLEKSNVETELAFLKNQINPHFFFNSLNNIYALVAIDEDKAQKAIEELSGLMRYLIYDSNVRLVPLSKEFEFTSNYIELMKKRVSSKVKLSILIQKEIPEILVPPLLFISFIENAFKHGISYREESFIDVKLLVDDGKIYFKCSNSIPNNRIKTENENKGIGIENSRKRLNLLYHNKSNLIINDNNEIFEVNLTLPIGDKNV